jgi:hypothetical protein
MALPDLLTPFLYAQMKFLERVGMAVAGFCHGPGGEDGCS